MGTEVDALQGLVGEYSEHTFEGWFNLPPTIRADAFGQRVKPWRFFVSIRRRHTTFDCDWISDVCSSDLVPRNGHYIMDIQRPSNARAKKIRRIIYGSVAFLLIGGVSFGLSRLRPAAPTVDRATIWTDDVKRGPMLREVRGLGTLVPEDIRWIPAQTNATVERIVLRPGAIVHPHSVILELSDPQLQRDLLDAEYQLKGAEADYANLKVQVNSQLMNQKSVEATVRSDYEQAH